MLKRLATLLLGIGLIGLGVMFFIAPEQAFVVQILMRYWPVFLILAGVVRVAGYLIDRHPRSPVSGMMITAIGGILLSANLLGHHSFLQILGKYWFWILLALIAGRVLKQYTHRIEDGARPRAFAPGAVVLMALIVGAGLAANYAAKNGPSALHLRLGGLGDAGSYFFGSQITIADEQPQFFSVPASARLIVNNMKGDVEVNSAAQSQASALLIKRIRAVTDEEAKEAAKNIRLQIVSDGAGAQFNIDSTGIQQDYSVSLIITVPENQPAHVEITNALGAVKMTGLRGDQTIRNCERAEISNNTGRVAIENPRGPLELTRIQGPISLINARHGATLRGINGAIALDLKGGALNIDESSGPIQLQAEDARIEMSSVGADSPISQHIINIKEARNSRIKIKEVRGAVAISAERSRIELEEVVGDLTIDSSSERVIAKEVTGSVTIKAGEAAVELENIDGPTRIEAERDVAVRNFRGPLSVSTERGAINLESSGKLTADLRAVNNRGKIRISIPEDGPFRLDANVGKGRVRVRNFNGVVFSRQERSNVIGYNISESAPLVSLRSGNGDIQLQSSGLALARGDEDD